MYLSYKKKYRQPQFNLCEQTKYRAFCAKPPSVLKAQIINKLDDKFKKQLDDKFKKQQNIYVYYLEKIGIPVTPNPRQQFMHYLDQWSHNDMCVFLTKEHFDISFKPNFYMNSLLHNSDDFKHISKFTISEHHKHFSQINDKDMQILTLQQKKLQTSPEKCNINNSTFSCSSVDKHLFQQPTSQPVSFQQPTSQPVSFQVTVHDVYNKDTDIVQDSDAEIFASENDNTETDNTNTNTYDTETDNTNTNTYDTETDNTNTNTYDTNTNTYDTETDNTIDKSSKIEYFINHVTPDIINHVTPDIFNHVTAENINHTTENNQNICDNCETDDNLWSILHPDLAISQENNQKIQTQCALM